MGSGHVTKNKSQTGPYLWTFLLPGRGFSFIGMEMRRRGITSAQPGAFPLSPGSFFRLVFRGLSTVDSKVLSPLSEWSRLAQKKGEIHSLAPFSGSVPRLYIKQGRHSRHHSGNVLYLHSETRQWGERQAWLEVPTLSHTPLFCFLWALSLKPR